MRDADGSPGCLDRPLRALGVAALAPPQVEIPEPIKRDRQIARGPAIGRVRLMEALTGRQAALQALPELGVAVLAPPIRSPAFLRDREVARRPASAGFSLGDALERRRNSRAGLSASLIRPRLKSRSAIRPDATPASA